MIKKKKKKKKNRAANKRRVAFHTQACGVSLANMASPFTCVRVCRIVQMRL